MESTGLVRWFDARDRRERVLIIFGGVVVLSYAVVVGLWQPLSALRADALAEITKYEAVTARIAAAGSDLAPASATTSDLPDAAIITDSAAAVGIAITRLEPEGERTRIELEDADFNVLINWLASLENDHALRVATIEVDRRPLPGVVSARISVEK